MSQWLVLVIAVLAWSSGYAGGRLHVVLMEIRDERRAQRRNT